MNNEIEDISAHFSKFLQAKEADSITLKSESYRIRHQVYCEELQFEPLRKNRQETDDVDDYSIPCLIQHASSATYAGTVRIVRPTAARQQIPLEKHCLYSITNTKLRPDNFAREHICEISRLAVPEQFRRRKMDKFIGAGTGAINEQTYSEEELRCFPFIAVGLYFTATSIVMLENIPHVYVMMEPRLARSMRFVGIDFIQLGPVVEYHGKRAPYYIDPKALVKNLSPGLKKMQADIESSIKEQRSHNTPLTAINSKK